MRIVVCVSGASGVTYAKRLLGYLAQTNNQIDLIISKSAHKVIKHEIGSKFEFDSSIKVHDVDSFDELASGTTQFDAVVIIPCSVKTIGSISCGISNNLIDRVADVALKENRKLILCPRETPLNSIHLKNMYNLSKCGVVIMPLMPGFYHAPESVSDLLDFMCAKIYDQLGIKHTITKRWDEFIKT